MAAVEVTLDGMAYDKLARTSRPVVFIGQAFLTGVGVGGGPMPGGGGPVDPGYGYPERPVDPGYGYPIRPVDPGYGVPVGGRPHPEHPIVLPPDPPPTGPADDNGFIKPPPSDGGWAYHETYGWGMYPKPGSAGPK